MYNDFKLVKGKRKRSRRTRLDAKIDFTTTSSFVLGKLRSVLEEFELSTFSHDIIEGIISCLKILNANVVNEIVCYGLGNFTDSKTSLHQLAALVVISRKFNAEVKIYDPIFTTFETEILKELNFEVLINNEEGKRKISKDYASLVFLPHCSKQLVNNFLWANWGVTLNKCILISNSLSKIITDNTKKILEKSGNYILKIQSRTKEITLNDTYHIENTFNDISIHYFDCSKLDILFFSESLEKEPVYFEDIEFITNNFDKFNVHNE